MPAKHKPFYTGANLECAVYSYWADNFGCPSDLFDTPGTTIFPRENLQGEGAIYHYGMKKHVILRMDPALIPALEQLVAQAGPSTALAPDDLRTFFGDARFDIDDMYPHFYLDPAHFVSAPPREDVSFRRLEQAEYDRLDTLFGKCSEHDLEEADIWLEEPDPVIFCGFQDDHMVAYASHRYLNDVIAEVGVLIHPEFRGRGLGRSVVSALSQWCIDNDKLPQYQVDERHTHSRRIPESLGYTRMFEVAAITIS